MQFTFEAAGLATASCFSVCTSGSPDHSELRGSCSAPTANNSEQTKSECRVVSASRGGCFGKPGELFGDILQYCEKRCAIFRTNDRFELGIMRFGMCAQCFKVGLSFPAQREADATLVFWIAIPDEQPLAKKLAQGRRQRGFVPSTRLAQFGLGNAGIVMDDCQQGIPPWPNH